MKTLAGYFPERPAGRWRGFFVAIWLVGAGAPALAHERTWQDAVGTIEAGSIGGSFEALSKEAIGFDGGVHAGGPAAAMPAWSDGDAAAALHSHYDDAEHGHWRELTGELEREYHHHHHTPPVPEPATWAGLALGLGTLAVVRRVRRKRD